VSTVDTIARFVYMGSAVCFVLGLHLMNAPATARRGNHLSGLGMGAAVLATIAVLVDHGGVAGGAWLALVLGTTIGAAVGLWLARSVQMTAMPQLVSLFNAVGGGAAALVALADYLHAAGLPGGAHLVPSIGVFTILDVAIGLVTLTGSIVAAGKLEGWVTSRPLTFPGARAVNVALALLAVGGAAGFVWTHGDLALLVLVVAATSVFGVTLVLPIGGADMPVVVSLLNACTGIAVAMAGFVVSNPILIVAGSLVGASGAILTKLMADAMNRSVHHVFAGGFGTGDVASQQGTGGEQGAIRRVAAADVAIQLAYASRVVIVPGYGLAAAQAQHAAAELARLLEERGVAVTYAIHPVAGRMPGHMNVLLAEADVPYPQLQQMEEANPELHLADVALVVGANDVTNPAARRPGNPLSGMPILDVDEARSIVVIKRSMSHGYAGIDNDLYTNPKAAMLFADAKAALAELAASVKALVDV